uniref:Uncharacterized protein n=1 Tax=Romanomermis culicivorax TaxID=13658 RepID=A0A915KXL7_ROMCU
MKVVRRRNQSPSTCKKLKWWRGDNGNGYCGRFDRGVVGRRRRIQSICHQLRAELVAKRGPIRMEDDRGSLICTWAKPRS